MAAVGELRVARGLPDDWSRVAGGASGTARPHWISLDSDRFPGPLLSFTFSGIPGDEVALCGTVIETAPANRRIDPFAVLSGAAVGDGLGSAGLHPWNGRSAEAAYPAGLIMFPRYESFPVGPGAGSRQALRRMVDALVEWGAGAGLRTLSFLYLTREAEPLVRVLGEKGFTVMPLTSSWELPVEWDDLSGYLARLPRKRRSVVRREMRELTARGIDVGERELSACAPRLAALRCGLVEKYGGTADFEREMSRLRRVESLFGADDITVVAAQREQEVVGFTLLLRDGGVWTAYLTGADQSAGTARLAYFATSYYWPAERAPRLGIRLIAYGPGSGQAKRLRGCRAGELRAAGLWLGEGER
ncbi:GNAT family N-acetyltransferase [Streptomyces sp. NL15-2K]|uniref:GNAT family N-acetyltransferase n=1 Tax=Streptomyces sp. NL15-2K TaxID=376149 RepID=UPI000F58DD96|nr:MULTISPECIES: GNAT family N-acetyltransferase [Actinomycetes]WKX10514.1 GNAT family N-acetyltransferase [Kutzneria buriramensis]GCB47952.1 hypothetical protein SNL152K_5274 [Streptomyces sp. NL15-2K]